MTLPTFSCRAHCGACCIAPSITTPIPGMPNGKPAGVRCIHLTSDLRCALFGQPERPRVCSGLRPRTGHVRPERRACTALHKCIGTCDTPGSLGLASLCCGKET